MSAAGETNPQRQRSRWPGARATAVVLALSCGALSCALWNPPPEPVDYGPGATLGLGMTYRDVLALRGEPAETRMPPWPPWPPTAMTVPAPPGVEQMRVVLIGDCVAAIEAAYPGSCEDDLARRLAIHYGPPDIVHGEYVWTDGAREVSLVTKASETSPGSLGGAPTCALRYAFARSALPTGQRSTTHGLAACRAMAGRHRTRFRPDPMHAFQRRVLDGLNLLIERPGAAGR